ncbi:SWIM zinc finger family protein [Cellulomonas alba]|uniref:SWIM zinc finger family protein n=1 Tax=Cellulomonas alba TaxID=3053467 RepID=A0ABT7SBV8_9CELL|nr:SWIM zinc finger family protein [Cellulomonas alba]MDM7853674.1 SWIM zinc finger family protein [Cellulomonas alba]
MPPPWSTEQVLSLSPDASSTAAARKLATPVPWGSTGATDAAVWGLCAGSGKSPYVTVVDLTGPAYSCSCPSRKFPCKHALALLVLWSQGQVAAAVEPAEFARTWLAGRAARAARPATSAAAEPVDEAAAARRVTARADRVAAGVADLQRWLRDQVTHGLAGADRAGYRHFEPVAGRLVDAQAPGLADTVRTLPAAAASGEGWPARLLEELALLHLLTTAHARLDELPDGLAAVVRRRIGFPTRAADVLATPAHRDTWAVLSVHDSSQDRLSVRRVHLHGTTSARDVAVVSFAAAGQPLDASLMAGTTLDADVHTYPGDPFRALVGQRHGEPARLTAPPAGVTLRDAARRWADALTADPWAAAIPVVLGPALVGVDGHGAFWVQDDTGRLPVPLGVQPWTALAVAGGRPVVLAVDYGAAGATPRAVLAGEELVAL